MPERAEQILAECCEGTFATPAEVVDTDRRPRHVVKVRRAFVRRLRTEGLSHRVIADWLGWDVHTVFYLAKEGGQA